MSNTDLLGSESANGTVDTAASGAIADGGTTESTQRTSANGGTKRRAGLTGMVLAELRELAGTLGITGTAGMRKGDLIAAIKERQGGGGTPAKKAAAPSETLPLGIDDAQKKAEATAPRKAEPKAESKPEPKAEQKVEPRVESPEQPEQEEGGRRDGNRRRRGAGRAAGAPEQTETKREDNRGDRGESRGDRGDQRGSADDRQGEKRDDRGGRCNERDAETQLKDH